MGFPQVEATNHSVHGPAGVQNHTVNLPAGIQADETLLVFFACDGIEVVTFPGGWTKLFERTIGISVTLAVAWRKASGGEGASITVTTAGWEASAHISHRISGATDPTVTAPEVSVFAEGTTINPNPGSLTAGGGSKEYLWIAVAGSDDGQDLYTAYPTNYADNRETWQSSNSIDGCNIAVATREIWTDTQDPGTFTLEEQEQWVACTVAVYPAVAVAGIENKSAGMGAKMIAGKLI